MDSVKEYGQEVITTEKGHRIGIVTIIGEIEGHTLLVANAKTTKYEHMIPLLIGMENDASVDGILFVLNTIGGDVECGLAMAELIAAIQKPTISLVIGGSHSIGIPLAVATDCSFIVPSATMLAHPVRMSGTVLGAPQTYYQFNQMQERIIGFICRHAAIKKTRLEELMLAKDTMAKDLGTILVGEEAVNEGLISHVGSLGDAMLTLERMIAGKKTAQKGV